jgi:hypothetical protein
MPKKKTNDWEVLHKAFFPKGHRWKSIWHLFSVILDYAFSDKFESPKQCLIYVMYHSNWINTNQEVYDNFSNKQLADITDRHLKIRLDQETIYALLGTSRNTFKKNFSNYLDIPKHPRVGELVLIFLNKWQDSNNKLFKPISKQELAHLEGLYPKKIAKMFVEVPQVKHYFEVSNVSYLDVKRFPPRLIEYFFEEIGEPERFEELVKIINDRDDLEFNK